MSAIVSNVGLADINFSVDGCSPATQSETAAEFDTQDEGPVLKTVWTVYDRVFPDGQREIVGTRTTRIRQKGPLPLQNRKKRGESEKRAENDADSSKRSKQAVRLRCKAIAADRLVTLTYRENMQNMELLKAHWDAFRRKLSKHKQFHYVAVVERQKRGAFHIHVAVRGRQSYHLLRSIWYSIVGKNDQGKPNGQVNVRNPFTLNCGQKGLHKLAAYLSKYISKDMTDHELNKKRYWTSKGIAVPEKNYYQLPYGTDVAGCYAHVLSLAANHNSDDNLSFFGNQALGVIWAATAPGLSKGQAVFPGAS